MTERERRERQHRLELKLRNLRPDYRSLLVLRDLEGLSYNEIAAVLDMPIGSRADSTERAPSSSSCCGITPTTGSYQHERRQPPADDLTPAERRLKEHLELLRVSPLAPTPLLVTRVIRSVGWQRAIRDPLVLVGAVTAAITDGLGLLSSRMGSACCSSRRRVGHDHHDSVDFRPSRPTLGAFILRLGGALALLVIGLLLTRLVARLVLRAMQTAGGDRLADRGGVTRVLETSDLGASLASLIARAIRIFLAIVVIFAALSLLGLQFLSESLDQAILALPKLFIAATLLLAGAVVAGATRQRAERLTYQLDFPVPLGQIVQVAVLAVFAIIAAAEIGISRPCSSS